MNNDNKFQLVDNEIIGETTNEKELVNQTVNNVNTEVEKKEDNTVTIDISKRRYFSFENRILLSVIAILILFAGACFLGLKVINHTTTQLINYTEDGDFTYQVCYKNSVCAPESSEYNAADINIIKVIFKYDTKYEKKIKHDNYYRVTTVLSVYGKNSHDLLYQNDTDLVKKTVLPYNDSNYSVTEVVTVDYAKYKELVKEYTNAEKQVEVGFYIEEKNETRKVASLIVPLSKEKFELNKYTTNSMRAAKMTVNIWDTYSIIYAVAASVLTVISLILIYRTTRLVLKVTNNKSEYQEAIDSLLKEYDNIIIVARDGYESMVEREVVKIEEFEELVKIRDEIDKPIIFSKVNNVKSEFIVESDNILYKYVLKEADFTEEEKNNLENK